MSNITLFSQLLQLLPRESFRSHVNLHQTDKYNKGINSWSHLVSMLFCQFGHLNSVRDIPRGLCSIAGNASHLGISKVPRNLRFHTSISIVTGNFFGTITIRYSITFSSNTHLVVKAFPG